MGSSDTRQGPWVLGLCFVLFCPQRLSSKLSMQDFGRLLQPGSPRVRKRQGLGLPLRVGVEAWPPLQGPGWRRVAVSRKGLEVQVQEGPGGEAASGSWGRANPGPECYEPQVEAIWSTRTSLSAVTQRPQEPWGLQRRPVKGTFRGGWGRSVLGQINTQILGDGVLLRARRLPAVATPPRDPASSFLCVFRKARNLSRPPCPHL